jgi:iron(III) transport system permease protein
MVVQGSLLVSAPGEAARYGLQNWQEAWSDPQVGPALRNSAGITLVRMVLAFLIAIPVAWLLARTNIPGAGWLEFGFWVSFFLPNLAYVQGWIFLLEGRVGLLNQWIQRLPFVEVSPLDIYSLWGIIWVHLMSHNVTTLVILFALAFRNVDSELEEASRICGSSTLGGLFKVTLPLIRPVFAMMVVLGIIRGLQSFEIERVLGQPVGIHVFGTLVVNMILGEPPRIQQGAALSVFILAVLVPLIVLQRMYVGRRQYTTVTGKMRPAKADLRGMRWVAFGLVATLVAMLTIIPFLSLVAGSFMTRWGYFGIAQPWTLAHWQRVLANPTFVESFVTTLKLGVLSAVAAVAVLFLVAYILVKTRFNGRPVLDFVSWLPWAIPGVLLSLGMLTMVLQIPLLRILHGSLFVLILAVILFRFPLGVHLLKGGLLQMAKELEEASSISGARWWYTQVRIVLPILIPMLVAVALMTFIAAVNEVSGIIMLAAVDTRTLSLLALDYMVGRGQKEVASVVITIVTLLGVGVALAARRFGVTLGDRPS